MTRQRHLPTRSARHSERQDETAPQLLAEDDFTVAAGAVDIVLIGPIGFDRKGDKLMFGLVEGATENASSTQAFDI